jgi:hypothetical protein
MPLSQPSLGRPANVYRISPRDLAALFKRDDVFETHEAAMAFEPGFGAVGYSMNGSRHIARITLVPSEPECRYFWVRVETPDNSVTFSVPAVCSRGDLKTLLEHWEFDMETKWLTGSPPSPHFPNDWPVASAYVSCPDSFWVLEVHPSPGASRWALTNRAGMHAVRRPKVEIFFGGIIAKDDLFTLARALTRAVESNPNIPVPKGTRALAPAYVAALREASATYFRERIFTVGEGRMHPVVPHAAALNIPLPSVTPFAP